VLCLHYYIKRFTVIPILICILGTAMRNVFFSQKVKRYYQSNDLTFSTCPASFCSCYMVYCFLNQCWITKFVHFICYICYITTRILQLIICCYISNLILYIASFVINILLTLHLFQFINIYVFILYCIGAIVTSTNACYWFWLSYMFYYTTYLYLFLIYLHRY
jgi:hypothetical protein